jgi:hypothetical protein
MPIALIGIFLMADFPILSKNSILPLSLIVLVFSGSIYYTFKVQIFKQFRKIDRELNEIEKLEE